MEGKSSTQRERFLRVLANWYCPTLKMSDVGRFCLWKVFVTNLQQVCLRMRLKQWDVSKRTKFWLFLKKQIFFLKIVKDDKFALECVSKDIISWVFFCRNWGFFQESEKFWIWKSNQNLVVSFFEKNARILGKESSAELEAKNYASGGRPSCFWNYFREKKTFHLTLRKLFATELIACENSFPPSFSTSAMIIETPYW